MTLFSRPKLADIVWLGDPAGHDVLLTGAKAAHLSRLSALHRVPPGFSVTSDAYRRVGEVSRVTSDLRNAIAEAYFWMGASRAPSVPAVAVRSSAIDEDGPLASFAGQHDTFLNVAGVDDVIEAIELCWASARTEQVLSYRRQHGLSSHETLLSVLVQELVYADVSAVMFSANPVSGSRDEIVVSASWGLGESIVGGTVTPDHWVVRRDDFAIVEQRIGGKERMTVPAPGGAREVGVPRLLRGQKSLTDEQVHEIAQLGASLEAYMGWPVDVECAFAGGELYLLQCRPITTLGEVAHLTHAPPLLQSAPIT